MSWMDHVTFSGRIVLYKGFDIGISGELIQDVMANTGIIPNDETIESMYNSHISVIRDKRIEKILSKN
jgi:hypothetical protein